MVVIVVVFVVVVVVVVVVASRVVLVLVVVNGNPAAVRGMSSGGPSVRTSLESCEVAYVIGTEGQLEVEVVNCAVPLSPLGACECAACYFGFDCQPSRPLSVAHLLVDRNLVEPLVEKREAPQLFASLPQHGRNLVERRASERPHEVVMQTAKMEFCRML